MNVLKDNTTTSPIRNRTLIETPELDTYAEYRASIVIWKVIPPILIILGTFGNILSILVLTRKAIRTSTTALYLTVLAFSDLIVLYTALLGQWLRYCFGIDVRTISELGCKIHVWLVYSFVTFSSWLLVLVTLDRVIAVCLPLKAKGICTKYSASVSVVSVGVFIMLLNSHLLYGLGLVYSRGNVQCLYVSHAYAIFFNNTWTWIFLCVFCMIPFFIIVTGNVLILTKVVRSRNSAKSRTSVASASKNRALYDRNAYMAVVLFTLNVFFLVSTTPINIYIIRYNFLTVAINIQNDARRQLWWAIVNMFMYCNNVFNFLLYCLTGTKFRRELIRMFCPEKPVTNVTPLPNLPRADDTCIVTSIQIPRYRYIPE